jgi:hypothetical protein
MTAWLSVLVPLLIMFFALGMERVERRLRETTVRQEELEEFLEHARPDEVGALFRSGTTRALEMFRLRSRRPGVDQKGQAAGAARGAITAGESSPAAPGETGTGSGQDARQTRVAS